MDQSHSRHDALVAAIEADEHPEWGEPDRRLIDRIEPAFVVTSWLLALAVTLAVAGAATAVFSVLAERPITGETGTELGTLGIIFGFSTFIGFATTMVWRLVRVDHDRFVNSMAVAALHVFVALMLFLGELVVRESTGTGLSEGFEGGFLQQIGNAFLVIERSAAAAVAACIIAVGMVPARGERPRGTQHQESSQDRQM